MSWVKSSQCDNGACVEVAFDGRDPEYGVALRNSKLPGEVVWFSRDEWAAFLAGTRNGEFDYKMDT